MKGLDEESVSERKAYCKCKSPWSFSRLFIGSLLLTSCLTTFVAFTLFSSDYNWFNYVNELSLFNKDRYLSDRFDHYFLSDNKCQSPAKHCNSDKIHSKHNNKKDSKKHHTTKAHKDIKQKSVHHNNTSHAGSMLMGQHRKNSTCGEGKKAHSEKNHTSEKNGLVLLNALEDNRIGEWLEKYTESNQLAGTNLEMVDWTLAKFKEFGLEDAFVDQYTALVSYPVGQSVKLLKDSKTIYEPSLKEDELDEDVNSQKQNPAFLGYSANGNVTAEYVYANYGTIEDFQTLVDNGVNISGKIVIARYGKIYRGLKVKFAQKFGASAVLLFTDIYDDGEVTGKRGFEAYPAGFSRNPSAIERGSALFLSSLPGDPTTPGYAIKPGEKKERHHHLFSTPQIPALPISFKEVQPILEKISGHGPKIDGWEGSVEGFDYSVGPNPEIELNLYSNQEFNVTNMNNIMGTIKGFDESKFIIIGNHHDSWTAAAADAHSGSAALLEVIRAFSELTKLGWKPHYSIKFASWDGEEYGLIGSTEFGEYYRDELKHQCIAYVNVDIAAVGNILSMASSPLLHYVLKSSASKLQYPNSTLSLLDHFNDKREGEIGTLGSGSDFTVFLEHLGIPSVNLEFKNDLKNSSVYPYHSAYDSLYWLEHFGDPGFVFNNLLSKYISLLALHLADEPILPLRTGSYASALKKYFNQLDIPSEWKIRNMDDKYCFHDGPHGPEFDGPRDSPRDPRGTSPHKSTPGGNQKPDDGHNPPSLGHFIEKIDEKISYLRKKSREFDDKVNLLNKQYLRYDKLSPWNKIKLRYRARAANDILHFYERNFIDERGLRDRRWFKHMIYASGRYTGYKGQELPGLAEAIENDDFVDFVDRLTRFDKVLTHLTRHVLA